VSSTKFGPRRCRVYVDAGETAVLLFAGAPPHSRPPSARRSDTACRPTSPFQSLEWSFYRIPRVESLEIGQFLEAIRRRELPQRNSGRRRSERLSGVSTCGKIDDRDRWKLRHQSLVMPQLTEAECTPVRHRAALPRRLMCRSSRFCQLLLIVLG
jgi:hypothetical protein